MNKNFQQDKRKLKEGRDKLLRLHKILMERERESYRKQHGPVSPGRFLGLLLGDPGFEWLRVLSTLIVRIDEAFDLDDGMSDEMLMAFRKEARDIFDPGSDEFAEFREKFAEAEPLLKEARDLKDQILGLMDR